MFHSADLAYFKPCDGGWLSGSIFFAGGNINQSDQQFSRRGHGNRQACQAHRNHEQCCWQQDASFPQQHVSLGPSGSGCPGVAYPLQASLWRHSLPSPLPQHNQENSPELEARQRGWWQPRGTLASSSSCCYHLSVLVRTQKKSHRSPRCLDSILKDEFFLPGYSLSHQAGSFMLYYLREGVWKGRRQSLSFYSGISLIRKLKGTDPL